MEKIAILTDSTADLPKELRELEEVFVMPLYVNLNGKYYKDEIDINLDEVNKFNELNKDNLAKSSAPSPGDFKEMFDKIFDQDFTKILCFTVSSGLSATHQICEMVASDYENIKVYDTKLASIGEGLFVSFASQLIRGGEDFSYICQKIEETKANKKLYIWLDSLTNLKKGGRAGGIFAKTAGILDLKPELMLNEEGKIALIKLKRKETKALSDIIERVREDLKGCKKYYLGLVYGKNENIGEIFEKEARDLVEKSQGYHKTVLGSVIGVHAGSKAFAVVYLKVE